METTQEKEPRARNYQFTLNNYTEEHEILLHRMYVDGHASYIMYGKEVGEQGTPHLQGYINFKNGKTLTAAAKFVAKCIGKQPHMEIVRKLIAMETYNKKGGEVVEHGVSPLERQKEGACKGGKRKADCDYEGLTEVVNMKSKDEAVEHLKKNLPSLMLMSGHTIMSNLDIFYTPKNDYIPYYKKETFIIPEEVTEWIAQIGQPRCNLLFLTGPPNTGKTAMIRSLGRHAYVSGMWNLEPFDAKYDYVVFDDLSWQSVESYLEPMRFIFLGKDEVTVTDKYRRKKRLVCQGKPCVIICNDGTQLEQQLRILFESDRWHDEVIFCSVQNKLYKQ